MGSTNKFKDFESLKKDIEARLAEIKAMQEKIKDSLQNNKELPLFLNNIQEIKDKINNLKEDITTKTHMEIDKILNSIETQKNNDLLTLKEKVNTLFKSKNITK